MKLPAGFTLENQEVKLPEGFTLEAEPPKPKTFLNKVTDLGKSVIQNAGEYYDYLHTPTEPAPFLSGEWFKRVLPESISKTTVGALEFIPKTAVELSGGAGKALNRLTQGQPAEAFREVIEPVAQVSEGMKQFIGKPLGFYGKEPFKEAWTTDPAGSALALYPGGKAIARKAKAIPKAMELKGLDVLEPVETPALRTPPQPVEALGTPKPPKGFTLEEKIKPVEQVKPPEGFTLETDVPDFEPPVKADLPSAETVTEPPQKAVPVITPDTPEKFATIADDFNKRMAKANVEGEKIDPVEVMKQVETDYSKTAPQIPQKTAFQKKMSELIDEETDPARKALLYIKSMGGLDMEALAKDYGKETRSALSKKGIGVVSSKGKARIDEVALDMGFPDGDTLINAILDTKSKKEIAKTEKEAFENYHYDNIRLAKKGFEKTDGIYPETLDTGDKVLINDESYTVRGFDKDGRVILKDGETLFVDPFEKLDAEGIKRATPKEEPSKVKEPWQMTREEWMLKELPDTLGSSVPKEQIANNVVRTIKNNPLVETYHTGKKGAEEWADRHIFSDTFTLAEIPIENIDWYGPEGTATKYKGESRTKGPIVIDYNENNLGRLEGKYGASPTTIVIDGTHRLNEARKRGDKTILAWVGNDVAPRFGIERVFQSSKLATGKTKNIFVPWAWGESHYQSVKQALSEGKPVPAEVLKDYPELAKKAKPEETGELPGLGFKDTFDLTSEGAGDVYKGALPEKAPAPKQENLFDTKSKLVKLEDIQKKNKPDMIIKKNVLANERGAINLDATKEALENIKDKLTIDAVPKMARAGVGDMAVQHASARIAVPKMVDDLLAKVFPDSYKDPAKMSKTIDILNKDNILGGYDSFITQATRDRLNNEFGASQRNLAAANRIKEKHDLNAYQTDVNAARLDPEIMGNIERWMKVIVPEFDRLFNEVKDVDPNTPRWGRGRNFDARINLVSDAKAEQIQKYLSDPKAPEPEPTATNYLNPHIKRDPFDRAADFTGQYTDDARTVLSAVLGPRWNEVTKIRMYKDLIKKGAAVEMTEGVEKPVMIQGQKPVAFIAEFPHTTENGYSFPSKKLLYVRKDIVNELRQVLNTEIPAESNKAAQILTNIQLAQIADAVTHSKNLLSVVSRAQGSGSAWYDVVRKMPVFNTFESIGRVIQVSREVFADTPEIRTEIAQMAKQGLIRPEFPATGIQKITHAQQFLHHVDTGARIIMNRFFDNLVERGLVENTLKNRRDYCNQVGQYNKRLMGFWMAKAAQSGLSPFIVAGRNFNRQGRNAITGNPGVEAISPIAAAQMRLTNLAGTAMLFTLPMMLNMLTTGEVGGRSGTPLGAWDMGLPEDEKGKHRTLDFTTIIGARRGMRSVGLDAAIEGIRQGHAPDQIAGQMFKDITGTMAHPWLGPAPQFAIKAVWGKQLDMRPDWTRQTVPEGGSKQIVENLRAATENQNPLVYAITRPLWQETGLDQKPEKPYFTELGETFLKSPYSSFGVRDMFPGQTAAEKAAQEISGSKFYGPSTKEEKERGALVGQYTRKLADALKKNEDINPIIDEVIKLAQDGKLHEKDLDKIEKNVEEPPLERRFSQMKIREALVVWNLATPEEKDRLVDMFEKKIDNLAEHDEQEFTKYEKQIMKAVNEYVDMKTGGTK